MELILNEIEVRVLGCLLEKEQITPDNYPLSLNSLKSACNQKSSRSPIMSLEEKDIARAIFSLRDKKLAIEQTTVGSRTAKYAHCINRVFDFSAPELAVLYLLFVRGPQTVGELRSRSSRYYEFANSNETSQTLEKLTKKEDGPYITELPVQPGKKEPRYAHLFSGEVEIKIQESSINPNPSAAVREIHAENERISKLEEEVEVLKTEINDLKKELLEFKELF
ncbi:MAG: YceH family protein [Verrucomicrobiota bacterium]|nr:YceH family protein [Verrucomicrobiota bacterium]